MMTISKGFASNFFSVNISLFPQFRSKDIKLASVGVSQQYHLVSVPVNKYDLSNSKHRFQFVQYCNSYLYPWISSDKENATSTNACKRGLLWLWNLGQTSPEVQKRGVSGPSKGPPNFLFIKKRKEKITLLMPLLCYKYELSTRVEERRGEWKQGVSGLETPCQNLKLECFSVRRTDESLSLGIRYSWMLCWFLCKPFKISHSSTRIDSCGTCYCYTLQEVQWILPIARRSVNSVFSFSMGIYENFFLYFQVYRKCENIYMKLLGIQL